MNGQQNEEFFVIPDKLVGLVIGRGGEQIKRLQAESGCRIKIDSDGNGSQDRRCTLQGSQECIDAAKTMLEDVVKRGMNRQSGDGERGGYQSNYNSGYQQQGGYQQGGNQYGGGYGQQGGYRR